ncbi:MAG: 50S ribosomal protein L22 [Candidatus Dormibacteria bacterium]
MEVRAVHKYVRRTPQKTRLVADLVKGMRVNEALDQLRFLNKAAALDVSKAIHSAAANAQSNYELDPESLVVKSVVVGEGPRLKRGRPRARGMFFQVLKRMSHITVVVEDRPQEEEV